MKDKRCSIPVVSAASSSQYQDRLPTSHCCLITAASSLLPHHRLPFAMSPLAALLVLVACVFSGASAFSLNADPVRLGVYYESLCPDSIAFVKTQLSVAYPALKGIMDVDINAYGKASDAPNTDGGGYHFTCQHGPDECKGNMMLACAKKYITDQETYVNFNICVMTSRNPPTSGEKCAGRVGVPFEEISTCVVGVEGQQLLHNVGVKTMGLEPAMDYIPWMVVNDAHTDEIQQSAQFDLVSFVCSTYEGRLPTACTAA